MSICLIQVPYMVGNEHHSGSAAPDRYIQAGAQKLLADRGLDVTVERVERGGPFRDSTQAATLVNKQLAAAVRNAIAAGRLPLVIGSSCEVSLGILAGFEHSGCGVVWLDAHGDFNTPETTISGFFPGMPLSVLIGDCYSSLWEQVGDSSPISDADVLLLGVRDLDPAERDRLENSAVRMVGWQDGKPQADVPAALDALARQIKEVYLHIDIDVFDPQVAPGADFHAPGGFSLEDMEDVIRAVAARFRIRAVALTAFSPDLDPDGRTLRAGLRVIELLGECMSA
jgi:arginase